MKDLDKAKKKKDPPIKKRIKKSKLHKQWFSPLWN